MMIDLMLIINQCNYNYEIIQPSPSDFFYIKIQLLYANSLGLYS